MTETVNPWHPRPCRLLQVREESSETFTWLLQPVDGAVPDYLPGQFNMLYLFAQGEAAISISGDPVHDPGAGHIMHTIRAVGSVTRAMQELQPGAVVGLRGPFGRGWPIQEARGQDLIIIAGGLGLAPLRPLVEWVLRNREDYGHIHILYGTRTPGDLLFGEDLQRWDSHQNVSVLVTVDSANQHWTGHVGTVTELIPKLSITPESSTVFLCGPELMMRFTLMALRQREVQTESIYLSMERRMRCALGYCGQCQYGPHFVCRDGPVFRYDQLAAQLAVSEL